ncbi:hypothetical protein V6C03_06255 [Methyloligella sp. 2.7D]|uniref:hypothetical protein n=1 Tax=unclassified Methyloligella TaxID=2625955 RepID=UPI00157CF0AE|nr:hypothetical protein [Methyloligella sp. GL2]QKP78491.1 hypothetical protein HT051_14200 [Methyloligella sp. GL2]
MGLKTRLDGSVAEAFLLARGETRSRNGTRQCARNGRLLFVVTPGLDPGGHAVAYQLAQRIIDAPNRLRRNGMDCHPDPASPARAQAHVKPGNDEDM